MRAYDLAVQANLHIVVTEEFEKLLMQDAESGAFPKLTEHRAKCGNDEQFLMEQLEIGVQRVVRQALPALLERYGLGCTVLNSTTPERAAKAPETPEAEAA